VRLLLGLADKESPGCRPTKPRLQTHEGIGNEERVANALAVTPDNVCQPCHDKVEQELAKPTTTKPLAKSKRG